MMEIRDPAIKLFGKTIPVTGDWEDSPHESNDGSMCCDEQQEVEKNIVEEQSMETQHYPNDPSPPSKEDSQDPSAMIEDNENPREPDHEKDTASPKDSNNDSKNSQQKPMKKPDKILPCPRCNSIDTKFCYYNNYNVNQPRHFCKSCQRYWTAGGAMRNVPVGAGRRKNKSTASRYCHITVSEALQAARLDVSNEVNHPVLKNNGTVLTFGSDNNPLCESMASVLNIAEKKVLNVTPRNGFHNIESNGHSSTTSSVNDGVKKGSQNLNNHNLNGFPNQMPCFQWPYMWNPPFQVVPFCPSGFPMSYYPPPPYWNGALPPWNVPWVPPCAPGQKSPGSNPNSPALGKHSRDGEMLKPCDKEKSSSSGTNTTTVLVPKTLRIDDPDEAAKSSIWTTLGINKEKGSDSLSKGGGGGFFNNFQTKSEKKDKKIETPPALQANPAALCRSINFQERATQ